MSFSMQLVGMDRAKLKLAMVEPEVRDRVVVAIEQTTNDVLSAAIARVPVKTGELRSTLRREYSKSGLTGFVKAGYGKLARSSRKGERRRTRALRGFKEGPQLRGIYAAIVEWGGKNRVARPYLVPAVESVRNRHFDRVAKAIRDGVAEVAKRK